MNGVSRKSRDKFLSKLLLGTLLLLGMLGPPNSVNHFRSALAQNNNSCTPEQLNQVNLNGDSVIDIFDLVIVGNLYGTNNPSGDINDDGQVDIFDLALIANCYNQPVPSPDGTPIYP